MVVVVWQMIRAPDAVSIDALLTYIGAPMGCGIVGYLAKSAFENKEKIKQQYIQDYETETEVTYEDQLGAEVDKP